MKDSVSFIAALAAIVGERNVRQSTEDMAASLIDVRRTYIGDALCVVTPGSTEEVAALVKCCVAHQVPIIPLGGNTGLVGGAAAQTKVRGVLLGLGRMNRVRSISPIDNTITVDAGCVLADIQRVASGVDRLFPLSLSAEGSCQIGGNIATNAGGTAALRYGVMRELVLGLEVVLPNGEILNGLLRLHKDNTGYDLRHLFIGSEGTLGIITGAVLKLFPAHKSTATAMLAVDDVDKALAVLAMMRGAFGERVTSAEIIGASYMDVVLRNVAGTRNPFEHRPHWNLLIEICDSHPEAQLREPFEQVLQQAFEAELISDAVVAQNESQAQDLWHLRHAVSDAIRYAGPNMSHDSSVPLDRQGPFAIKTEASISARFPESEVLMVGHMGDGNMHIVVLFKPDRFDSKEAFKAASNEIDVLIDDVVVELEGSITAEHGIGLSYRERLLRTADPAEITLMRGIKSVFDPQGLMNPGKIFEMH